MKKQLFLLLAASVMPTYAATIIQTDTQTYTSPFTFNTNENQSRNDFTFTSTFNTFDDGLGTLTSFITNTEIVVNFTVNQHDEIDETGGFTISYNALLNINSATYNGISGSTSERGAAATNSITSLSIATETREDTHIPGMINPALTTGVTTGSTVDLIINNSNFQVASHTIDPSSIPTIITPDITVTTTLTYNYNAIPEPSSLVLLSFLSPLTAYRRR